MAGSSTEHRAASAKSERQLQPVGYLSKLPGGKQESGPLGPLSFFTTLGDSEVMLWRRQEGHSRRWRKTTVYFPEADRGESRTASRRASQFAGIRDGEAVRPTELPVADVGSVLRHRIAAAHSDSLLHRQRWRGGAKEHDCRHRDDRLLLRPDAVPGARGDDQRSARFDRLEHGRTAAGTQHEPVAIRRSFRRSHSRPCWGPSAA